MNCSVLYRIIIITIITIIIIAYYVYDATWND